MPIISPTALAKADKILFITHLAIGDFTYLQNFFSAFAKQNPHLKIDIWIDELRRSNNPEQWKFLEKYALYDWAENCPFFRKVYRRTYSPQLLNESIQEAQRENYSIVVSLATLRPYIYANLARMVGPDAFVVGIKGASRWYAPWDKGAYAKLDKVFTPYQKPKDGYHITAVYADWFRQLSDLHLDMPQRFPFIDIPAQWQDYATRQLNEWGVNEQTKAEGKRIVFINAYAKTKKRCWPLSSVAALIIDMNLLPSWSNTCFIVNAVPQELDNAKQVLATYKLKDTHLFSANENFYQLPALLQHCDLIISVETAVMHLANAVHVPVIALMRQKNPEWVPINQSISTVITTQRRNEWVSAIKSDLVIKAIQ